MKMQTPKELAKILRAAEKEWLSESNNKIANTPLQICTDTDNKLRELCTESLEPFLQQIYVLELLDKFYKEAFECEISELPVTCNGYAILKMVISARLSMNVPVKINQLKDKPCELYSPYGFVGILETELQFTDVRVQIMKQKLSGYYIMLDGEKIIIDSDGRIENWLDGLFDVNTNLLMDLM